MIRIKSKRHNFRRCGMPHPKQPVDYPDDQFAKKELAILKAEPMLIVEVIPDEEEPDSKTEKKEGGPEEQEVAAGHLETETEKWISIDDITVAQIKAELDIRGVEYPDKAKKAELFKLLKPE